MIIPRTLLARWFVGTVACLGVAAVAAHDVRGEAQTPVPTTYFVSVQGNDAASGTRIRPWRTVGRVNRQRLNPGDRVLFNGRHTFADAALKPAVSGEPRRPIVFGSYGRGRASVARIYLNSVHHLRYQDLSIRGASNAILASASGAPVHHISLVRNRIVDAGIGIHSGHPGDTDWTIRDNVISRTGDSGMLLFGDRFNIRCNVVTRTGLSPDVPYPKHGLYVKASNAVMIGNTIEDFSASGISVRSRNSVIKYNTIGGGPVGVGWYQEDAIPGASYWRNNRISGTTRAGMLVTSSGAPPGRTTRESFTITGNAITKRAGEDLSLAPTSGTYTVARSARARKAGRAGLHECR